jgi:hypothetical protein
MVGIMDAKHFRSLSDQNIHMLSGEGDVDVLSAEFERIASEIGYQYTVLHGDRMGSETESLQEIEGAFNLPKVASSAYRLSWDGAADYLGEMRWPAQRQRNDGAAPPRGHLIYYREPERLIAADAAVFAILLSMLGSSWKPVPGATVPVHVAIGPLNYRHEFFVNLLLVSRQICSACRDYDE